MLDRKSKNCDNITQGHSQNPINIKNDGTVFFNVFTKNSNNLDIKVNI